MINSKEAVIEILIDPQLEEQVILDVPIDIGRQLEERIDDEKELNLEIEMHKGKGDEVDREMLFILDGEEYGATLTNLPTIVETHKTFDGKNFFKSADVHQMIVVKGEEDKKPVPLEYPHGLSKPMRDARKKQKRSILNRKLATPGDILACEEEILQMTSERRTTYEIVEETPLGGNKMSLRFYNQIVDEKAMIKSRLKQEELERKRRKRMGEEEVPVLESAPKPPEEDFEGVKGGEEEEGEFKPLKGSVTEDVIEGMDVDADVDINELERELLGSMEVVDARKTGEAEATAGIAVEEAATPADAEADKEHEYKINALKGEIESLGKKIEKYEADIITCVNPSMKARIESFRDRVKGERDRKGQELMELTGSS